MSGESKPTSPAEEIVKLWQLWMSAGLDAMQRAQALFAPGARPPESAAGLREQLEKTVRAAFEAARIPSAADVRQFAEGLERLRADVDGLRAGLAALELAVKGQHTVLEAMEATVRQASQAQQDAIASWTHEWEERITGLARGLEEWRRGWEDILRPGVVASQAAQRSLEDLSKSMWDLSQRVVGGQR